MRLTLSLSVKAHDFSVIAGHNFKSLGKKCPVCTQIESRMPKCLNFLKVPVLFPRIVNAPLYF